MRVLLIRPPIHYVRFSLGVIPLGFYSSFLTRYPPHGLMVLAAQLRRAGHEVVLLDAEAEELEIESAAVRLAAFAPELIVGSVNVYNSYRNFADLSELKRRLGAPLVVRGHFPSHYPDDAMAQPAVDAAMTGKGNAALVPLVAAFARGAGFDAVPGLLYREDGRVCRTPDEPPVSDLDSLPFPARDLVDPALYSTSLSYRRPFTTMFASYGCPYQCVYCQDRNVPYRRRSVDSVLNELDECVHRHGIREVTFLDPTFTAKRDWALDLCRRLAGRRLDLTFTIRTRPDLVDPELIDLLARAGCVRISLGLESGDPEILAGLQRPMKLETMRQAVAWIRARNIMVFGFFMVGNRGETAASLGRTLAFVKELPLDFAQFIQTLPIIDSAVLDQARQARGIDIWREIGHGRYPSPEEFRSAENELSLAELGRWTGRLYRAFYLNPRRWRAWLSLRFLPGYALRQVGTTLLTLRLVALRRLRRRWPGLLLARYPSVRNGGPGAGR